jgi:(p)ppGpp synthase/HD superfamily hydrolase
MRPKRQQRRRRKRVPTDKQRFNSNFLGNPASLSFGLIILIILQLEQEKAELHAELGKKMAKIVEMYKEVEKMPEELEEKANEINTLLVQLIGSIRSYILLLGFSIKSDKSCDFE